MLDKIVDLIGIWSMRLIGLTCLMSAFLGFTGNSIPIPGRMQYDSNPRPQFTRPIDIYIGATIYLVTGIALIYYSKPKVPKNDDEQDDIPTPLG